ncbi:heme exporter protein CcmD [Oricola thermophila]|uniref:Heme exporter protein D n=1 Tax=Oricola thermophila TaxID=2742145 RepID=A0A6N1VG52_9HYPH|nr:heme exporter protein CcmD [Oricola thermophila]QKV19900.1 heme exporter protein CcmD [Oricola thermophila]
MTHEQFVLASYALTVLVLGGLGLWLWLDRRARLAEMKRLEEAGLHRRSENGSPRP